MLDRKFWNITSGMFLHLGSLYRVLAKFYFYYNENPEELPIFLSRVQELVIEAKLALKRHCEPDFADSHSISDMYSTMEVYQGDMDRILKANQIFSPLTDIFLQMVVGVCNHLRNESVLIHYLRCCSVFRCKCCFHF
jgi:hypothetical protein